MLKLEGSGGMLPQGNIFENGCQKAKFGNFSDTKWYKIKTSYIDDIATVHCYTVYRVTTICVYDNCVLECLD